jgi:DNA-binding HxlR family transcriptional regulator
MHYAPKEVVNVEEFPLQSSSALKEALKEVKDANHRKILILLDQTPTRVKNLCRQIKEMSYKEIDKALTELQEDGLV